MAEIVRVEVDKFTKLYYDENKKILYVDEIPNGIYNRTVYYPAFGNVEPAGYKKRIEVIVPHKHLFEKGVIEINDIAFPLWCIPHVEKITKFEYEGYHWIRVDTKLRMYQYSFISSEGMESDKYLEINKELPPYLKDINIWKK